MKVKKYLLLIHFPLSLASKPLFQAKFEDIEKGPFITFIMPCTGITEIIGSDSVQAWIFFRP